jgi:hypothetical protein
MLFINRLARQSQCGSILGVGRVEKAAAPGTSMKFSRSNWSIFSADISLG